jgi:hypothetical protein
MISAPRSNLPHKAFFVLLKGNCRLGKHSSGASETRGRIRRSSAVKQLSRIFPASAETKEVQIRDRVNQCLKGKSVVGPQSFTIITGYTCSNEQESAFVLSRNEGLLTD